MTKNISIALLSSAFVLLTNTTSYAGTIGTLTWDGTNDYITHASGDQYIQLALFKGLTYAETEAELTNSSSAAFGFRIANEEDAWKFYQRLGGSHTNNILDNNERVTTELANVQLGDGALGNTYDTVFDIVYFDSSNPNAVGSLEISGIYTPNHVRISEKNGTRADVDSFFNDGGPFPVSWLLVKDAPQVSAVPLPTTLPMMASALTALGFMKRRRKS